MMDIDAENVYHISLSNSITLTYNYDQFKSQQVPILGPG
jgi:hypothetical protein